MSFWQSSSTLTLPVSCKCYITTVQLKDYLDNLKSSAFFFQIGKFETDKTVKPKERKKTCIYSTTKVLSFKTKKTSLFLKLQEELQLWKVLLYKDKPYLFPYKPEILPYEEFIFQNAPFIVLSMAVSMQKYLY